MVRFDLSETVVTGVGRSWGGPTPTGIRMASPHALDVEADRWIIDDGRAALWRY